MVAAVCQAWRMLQWPCPITPWRSSPMPSLRTSISSQSARVWSSTCGNWRKPRWWPNAWWIPRRVWIPPGTSWLMRLCSQLHRSNILRSHSCGTCVATRAFSWRMASWWISLLEVRAACRPSMVVLNLVWTGRESHTFWNDLPRPTNHLFIVLWSRSLHWHDWFATKSSCLVLVTFGKAGVEFDVQSVNMRSYQVIRGTYHALTVCITTDIAGTMQGSTSWVLLSHMPCRFELAQRHAPGSEISATGETPLYYKACTKYFLVLPSPAYFALQSLHKALPSTTLSTLEVLGRISE